MLFDRNMLQLKLLAERVNDLDLSIIRQLEPELERNIDQKWSRIAQQIIEAKNNGAAIIMLMGGHVFRSGIQKFIIDLMRRGYISHLATNGSGMIHDFEYALIGATTENVARYIKEGQFGLWRETGMLNDLINEAYKEDKSIGMGEAISKAIFDGDFPHKDISLFAAAQRLNIPITVHVGIGQDIIHEHPNCDGAATGALSYNDFLKFTASVQKLENGVVMNFGSAVMGPEVFLKALSMARNAAKQHNKSISRFLAAVFDLYNLPENYLNEPSKDDCSYYYRPWKTMLLRTIAGDGQSMYFKGKHEETIPAIWSAINTAEKAALN